MIHNINGGWFDGDLESIGVTSHMEMREFCSGPNDKEFNSYDLILQTFAPLFDQWNI